MNSVSGRYSCLLREHVSPFLVRQSFKRTGQSYTRATSEVLELIHFQRSTKSSASELFFTVDLGIASKRICDFWGISTDGGGSIGICHWRERVGRLLPEGKDYWWTIKPDSNIGAIGPDLIETLKSRVLPTLDSLAGDIALRDLWISGASPGTTRVQRLLNLLILLDAHGPNSELQATVAELLDLSRGLAVEQKVKRAILRLGLNHS